MRTLTVLSNAPAPAPDSSFDPTSDQAPWYHLIEGERPLMLLVERSQVFELSPELFDAVKGGDMEAESAIQSLRQPLAFMDTAPGLPAGPRAVSLNIAQTCNLSCAYCYADEGLFGGRPRLMSEEVAHRVISDFIEMASGGVVTIGFIGGEPLLNRQVLHSGVAYALRKGRQRGVETRFSITTNATLLQAEDITLLRDNGFAVSVSLDGDAATHDRHRRSKGGSGSFATAIEALQPLLCEPGRAKVAVRATITHANLCIAERVEALADLGFREVGVSPLRSGPDAALILNADDWPIYLAEMIRAAEVEKQRISRGEPMRFSNFALAMKEIHRGTCRPLPCGAAANYISASAEGNYFTCHRTIDDSRFAIGSATLGISQVARQDFLATRHVDRQQPCASCWARYLCGGGCHAEVVAAGRSGCDYIRGWLEYCLLSYNQIIVDHPTLFDS